MQKIALITGANKGIGLETARQLGKLQYTILLGARDKSRGEQAASDLRKQDIDVQFLEIDPTNVASVANAAQNVEKNFGYLDVLINNAGFFSKDDFVAPSEVPLSAFRETYEINVFGAHEVTRAFWTLLNKSKAARLVNVSSLLGSLAMHADGALDNLKAIAYDSSKAALNMMTVHYAFQWKNTPHRANCIHPGSVKTDMNANGDLTVEEGAKTSVELATIANDGPNGQFFHLGKQIPW